MFTYYLSKSLLQYISKIFAKLLFKLMYMVLCENKLITKHQSRFTLGDSTINQLISIGDNIYKKIWTKNDVLAIFLDFTKVFHKVEHAGLVWKF